MGYSFDPAGAAWLLLGCVLMLSLVMGAGLVFAWRLIGSHVMWALGVAARRSVDRRLGTGGPGKEVLIARAATDISLGDPVFLVTNSEENEK